MIVAAFAVAGVVVAGLAGRSLAPSIRPIAPPGPQPAGPARRRRFAWARPAALIVSCLVIGFMAGWLATPLAALSWFGARRLRMVVRERARRHTAARELPDAIERLVLIIHAGLTPAEAVRVSVEIVPDAVRHGFERVVHHLDRGQTLAEALRGLPDDLGPTAAPVADAFASAARYGHALEPTLDLLAREARAARRRLDEADARRLPVRLSAPLVVGTLPSFVLVAIAPAVIAAISSLGGTAW